jgi:hypothetical protein
LDRWLKLHIFKTFLNAGVRVLNLMVPKAEPTWPQSQIVRNVFARMHHAYAVEAYCGRFDDIPYQSPATVKDKNFLRVLEVSEKLLYYLGEMDRYYRQWLGLFLLVTRDIVDNHAQTLNAEEACRQINGQWGDYAGLNEGSLKLLFPEHRDLAQEMVLCNHLHNLVTLTFEGGDKNKWSVHW